MKKNKKWMLAPLIVLAALALGFGAARWVKKEGGVKAPNFLPGIYTCIAANEFCRIDDTLTVRRTQMGADDYLVTRHTRFIRIRGGRESPEEPMLQQWKAHYDADRFRLVSVNEVDTVRYYPEKNRVSKANFYYEKIE